MFRYNSKTTCYFKTESWWEKRWGSVPVVSVVKHSGRKQLGAQVRFSALLWGHQSGRSCQVVTSHPQSRTEKHGQTLVCLLVLGPVSPRLRSSEPRPGEWHHPQWAESSHIWSQVSLGCVHLTGRTNQHRC